MPAQNELDPVMLTEGVTLPVTLNVGEYALPDHTDPEHPLYTAETYAPDVVEVQTTVAELVFCEMIEALPDG